MELSWDGTLDMMLLILAFSVGAIYLRSRVELAVALPTASLTPMGYVITSITIPARRMRLPSSPQIRLPRKLPAPDEGATEAPASIRQFAAS
jgi:hypothetical protein